MKYHRDQYLLFIYQVIAHIGLLLLLFYGTWLQLLISFVFYYVLSTIGASMTYHRLLSHRSYNPPRWFEILGSIMGVLCLVGSPVSWVAMHKQHHKHSDQELDPHSPVHHSFIQVMYLEMFSTGSLRGVASMLRDPFQLFLHKYYFLIHAAIFAILLIINPWSAVYLYLAPVALVWSIGNSINYFNHMSGYRNHETKDNSRNNPILAILFGGEGWHNNHHANPAKYHLGEKWWEFDLSGFIIKKFLDRPIDK